MFSSFILCVCVRVCSFSTHWVRSRFQPDPLKLKPRPSAELCVLVQLNNNNKANKL